MDNILSGFTRIQDHHLCIYLKPVECQKILLNINSLIDYTIHIIGYRILSKN